MLAYFDYAATSYRKPRCVYKAIKDYKKFGVSVGRGKNKHSNKCNEIIEETRCLLKKLVKAGNGYKTIFQPSATYAFNAILKGVDYTNIENVYITAFEHNSVLRPLYALQLQYKFNIIILQDYFQQFTQDKPDIVIVSHVANTFGIIQKYEDIFKESKKFNAINILDMAQSFGLIETNIEKGKVDAAIFSGHKTLYGLTNIGGIIINNTLKLKDTIQGGTGIDSSSKEMPKERPTMFEAGTQNILGIISLNYSCKFLIKKTYKKIFKIENKNYLRLKKILNKFKFLKVLIPNEQCTTIIACNVIGYSAENFADYFSRNGIAIRTGLQCSPLAHKNLGTFPSGTIRFSVGLFNKNFEFIKLNHVLKKLNKKFDTR